MNRTQSQAQARAPAHAHEATPLQPPMQLQTAGTDTAWPGHDPIPPTAPHAAQERALSPQSLTLTEVQAETLIATIEEERMAGDVYELLAEQTGLIVFDRIAASEDRHHDTLVMLAQAADIDLSAISGLPAGQYADAELQSLYDSLIAQAGSSKQAALEVGIQIETLDIADLHAALVEVVGTPLWTAYSHLLEGSQHHLAALDGLIGG